ncbi:Cytochrome c, class I [Oceanobacter sp. RED65]|uniref:Cytochrome c, class I n=1 Tax=Bermanella marisrubri TaxID=207949 RepID=Q1MZI7_9GAMM|nr:Cytochrome c, class I [Oceanobacter sp. RED65] [Bermanella marisrubri]
MESKLKQIVLALLAPLLFLPAFAIAENTTDFQDVVQQMRDIKGNQVDYQIAIQEGQERSMLCGYCHGKDGNSVKNDIPNLAEQNTEYLLKQFELFASGERKSYVMGQLSKSLTTEERINLSLFYSSQTVKPQTEIETSERGKEKYQTFCFACHGEDGHGNADLPRLAGQKYQFLVETLTAFKRGEKSRANSPMVKIMKTVDAKDIEPLARYIANMP